jgi:hypothetical protein
VSQVNDSPRLRDAFWNHKLLPRLGRQRLDDYLKLEWKRLTGETFGHD